MRLHSVMVVMALLGCGRASEIAEVSDQRESELAARKAVLGATLSDFARGIVSRDEGLVFAVLSNERLAKIESAGGIAAVMEEQGQQLRRAFGEDADFNSERVEVVAVDSLSSDQVLAATVSFRGREL